MENRVILGLGFVLIAILLSVFSLLLNGLNGFSLNATGGVIGLNSVISFLGILTIVFFLSGLIIIAISRKTTLEGLLTLGLVASVGFGMHKLSKPEERYFEKQKEKENTEIVLENVDSEGYIKEEEYNSKPKTTKVTTAADYNKKSKPNSKTAKVTKVTPTDYAKKVYHWATDAGKFQRTYRYDKLLDNIEEKYGIPWGVLKGLAMQESFGDPLRLNESGDGGAGFFMMQPGTARELGLKVLGSSNVTGKDSIHGAELKAFVKKYKNNYAKLAQIDERFDVRKASDAAARHLRNLYYRHGTWDKAISAYNRGSSNVAKNPLNTPHVQNVRKYQTYYNKRDKN